MAVKRTPEQEAVVKNRGGGLLVSAAAGSGKTRVLVERLLDRILNEGKNIDEFLIITFTRAAAAELRARIAKELSQALRGQPENAHLRRQATLLYKTQISTIHAFCTTLLRQWGHLLDIPTDFSLCEEEEAAVLMTRTLDQLLEERYETIEPDGPFAQLVDVLSAGRDDSRLMDITLDVFGKLQSARDPLGWLEAQRKALDLSGVADVGQTPWGALLLEEAAQTAGYWAGQMEKTVALAQRDPVLERCYTSSLRTTIQDLTAYAQAESWDEMAARTIQFPRFDTARGVEDKDAQAQIKFIRDRCRTAVKRLTKEISGDSAALLRDMALVSGALEGLLDLVRDFTLAYQEEKARRAMLDFSDLEHLAAELLIGPDGAPTETARQWGAQYTEIMVDEYQDTNQVQDAIFQALSHQGRNLFMVGDVKQSIYRFRLADPTIFLNKYRTFAPWERAGEGTPRSITMSRNFRSRPEVLEAVNDLFQNIMSDALGEMAYTDAEALHPGGTFPEGTGYETELHVLDFSEDPARKEEALSKWFLEARFVAKRIAALLNEGFPISDGAGGTRPLQPDDIAILLRSPRPVRPFFTAALEEQGISWASGEGEAFFQTTEVSAALSWLQIIDNPRQDVPLLAALRSPVCGFTGDRLAEIRGAGQGDFYTALQAEADNGAQDCAAFLSQLAQLRFAGMEESSHTLLWNLYQRMSFLEIFSAMPGGEKRRQNLLALCDLARRFENTGHKGLFRFLLHLDRVQASGGLRSAPSAHKQTAGVRIMSIHRSKGLEFPVVFLCGLGRDFNKSDLQKPVLFHAKLGLGAKALDRERMVQFTTIAHTGVAAALKKELLAEEMRLLYVAMTRAQEKLILVHSLSRGRSELESLAKSASVPADPQVLKDCSNPGKWLLLTALIRPEGTALRQAAGAEEPFPTVHRSTPAWTIAYHTGAASQEAVPAARQQREDPALVLPSEEIIRQLQWRYPYQAAAAVPAKVTATQVAGQSPEDEGVFLLREEAADRPAPVYRPQFAQNALGLTPAQEGSALHTVMQVIRLDRTGSAETVQEELDRLAAEAYLTERQAGAVDPRLVARFFRSPLGREMKENPTLRREYPFSLLCSAARFFPNAPAGEDVLLQGVIDAWFQDEEGITLIDFKSDRVSPQKAVERGERYRGQLAAYAYALETLTGRPVRRQILWFLRPGVPVLLGGRI